MKVKQVYDILNAMAKEILGETAIVNEDLTNVVDIGKSIFDATAVDNYVSRLINHIGRVVFVDRSYSPVIPSIMKDNWEFGSIMEKIDCDMPESTANPKWQLANGQTYNQDVFVTPTGVRAKFFNDGVTYQVPMSFTDDQVKESFSSAQQLRGFFTMVETKIRNRLNIDYANLTRATINSFIGATIFRDFSAKYSAETKKFTFGTDSYNRSVNLLGLYKEEHTDSQLTPQTCLKDLDFIKFASYKMGLYVERLRDMSTLFNIGGKERFTPTDLQHFVLLNDFKKAADVYLQSDTFHNEFTKMPESEGINYWQGTGTDYSVGDLGRIHVKIKVTTDGTTYVDKEIDTDGAIILGCLFDNDALGINNEKSKTTSHYNASGDFINNFYKSFARYFTDHDENFVVFFVA